MLPYGRQQINEADMAAVIDTLSSDWLTTGPRTTDFEKSFAARVGAKHAVAVANGTAALHLAMLVADIGPGDRVLTTPNTFLASANCAAYVGATPDFVDIDPVSYNLSPERLKDAWQPDVKAIVPVHYAGGAADVRAIHNFARERNAIVIEDACHAVGGQIEVDGKCYPIGGHPWADMSTFSFHPVKTLTTGEGGMLVTDNDEYARRARLLRTHGVTREANEWVGLGKDKSERGPWYYEMHELGYNFRITDLQCALGLSQLSRLDTFVKRRREIVSMYNDGFSDLWNVQTPCLLNEKERDLTSWHLYTLQIAFDAIGKTRSQTMRELFDREIGTQVLYIPIHLQPFYQQNYGYGPGKCPIAETFYERTLSLPLFPAMSDKDVIHVIEAVHEVVGSCSNEGMVDDQSLTKGSHSQHSISIPKFHNERRDHSSSQRKQTN